MKRQKTRKKKTPRAKSHIRKNSYFPRQSLIYLWQIIFFWGLSGFFILSLINNGWSYISVSKVKIKGNQIFKKEEIIKASGINFPKPLIEIIPKRVEANLKSKLSLEAASIHRQIIPIGIVIEVLEKQPAAYAQRIGANGLENGMIDKNAEWIPLPAIKSDTPKLTINVTGWKTTNRNLISFILQHQKQLGSPLKKISLNPLGEINLTTEIFNSINLGSNHEQLKKQIKILAHLSENLPPRFLKENKTTIDLTDPSKPELQTGKPY